MVFAVAPFIGWLVSGCLKFAINYIRFGKDAKSRIGNGGFPSTHTTIMTTTTEMHRISGVRLCLCTYFLLFL